MKIVTYRITICLFFLQLFYLSVPTLAQSNMISGYTLAIDSQGLMIRSVLQDGQPGEIIATLDGFTLENQFKADLNLYGEMIFALSPDAKTLAFIVWQDDMSGSLLLLDVTTGIYEQQTLTNPIEQAYSVSWSPDSTKLFIILDIDNALIYDVVSGKVIYTLNETASLPLWLPDSQQFIYIGPSTCRAALCRTWSDLYLVDLKTSSQTALTHIDADKIGLVDKLNHLPLLAHHAIYVPDDEMIYFILSEAEDGPIDIVLLASVDLQGNMQIEADIYDMYPDSFFMDVHNIFYDEDNKHINTVVTSEGDVPYRWSILQYTPSNELEVLYERSFETSEVEIITSMAVSPDGNRIAIGGSYPNMGSTTVVDLLSGEILWQNNDLDGVCNIHWADIDSIFFSQPDYSCPMLRRNTRFDQLFYHNISKSIDSLVVNSQQNEYMYFASVFPEIPTYPQN
ncbi:MAG: hypothetical protein CL607_22405 [Anaerolineaceae bacterium]|nr:hypothetical protein [Anaerolineaceae bacterium]